MTVAGTIESTAPSTAGQAWTAARLPFTTPFGHVIHVHDLRVDWSHGAYDLTRVGISFSMPYATWLYVDSGQLFHLTPESRGPMFGDELAPGQPVLMGALLAPALLGSLAGAEDIFDLAIAMRQAPLRDPLRMTESYFATHVVQQRSPMQVGFRTNWGA